MAPYRLAYLPLVPGDRPDITLLGVRYACLSEAAALAEAERLYEGERPATIAVTNAHGLNLAYSDPSYRAVLQGVDLVLNDGKGVMLGALMKGRRFSADLNGNRFAPLLLERAAARGWSVYFLGGRPGVAERAAERARELSPRLQIVGTRDGYFSADEEESVIAEIRGAEAGLLFVALGNPRQEQWLDRNLARTGARLGIGVGAFFDFMAQEVPRAPRWMNRVGLEWAFRLAKEPRRLWRRYLLGNPLFLWRVLRERVGRPRAPRVRP